MESVQTLFKISHIVSWKSDLYLPPIHTGSLPIMLILVATLIKSINLVFRKLKSFLQPLGSDSQFTRSVVQKANYVKLKAVWTLLEIICLAPRKFYLATICIISPGIVNNSKIGVKLEHWPNLLTLSLWLLLWWLLTLSPDNY